VLAAYSLFQKNKVDNKEIVNENLSKSKWPFEEHLACVFSE